MALIQFELENDKKSVTVKGVFSVGDANELATHQDDVAYLTFENVVIEKDALTNFNAPNLLEVRFKGEVKFQCGAAKTGTLNLGQKKDFFLDGTKYTASKVQVFIYKDAKLFWLRRTFPKDIFADGNYVVGLLDSIALAIAEKSDIYHYCFEENNLNVFKIEKITGERERLGAPSDPEIGSSCAALVNEEDTSLFKDSHESDKSLSTWQKKYARFEIKEVRYMTVHFGLTP